MRRRLASVRSLRAPPLLRSRAVDAAAARQARRSSSGAGGSSRRRPSASASSRRRPRRSSATCRWPRPADVDRAVAAARQAFDDGPWPAHAAGRAGRGAAPGRRPAARAHRRHRLRRPPPRWAAPSARRPRPRPAWSARVFDYYADLLGTFELERRVVTDDRAGARRAGPRGRGGRHRPLERAGHAGGVEGRPGAGRRLHGRAEAAAGGAAQRVRLRRGAARPRASRRASSTSSPATGEAGEHLVTHPGIDKVAFTGSTDAGKRIMALCAERVTRVSLELGGKSAAIVCDDADLDRRHPPHRRRRHAPVGPGVRRPHPHPRRPGPLRRGGRGRRRRRRRHPVRRPVRPRRPSSGPLVAERQRDRVEGFIASALAEGARVGHRRRRGPAHLPKGWYVPPTILADVAQRHAGRPARRSSGRCCRSSPFDGEDDAVRIANDSRYGLSGGVWTGDDGPGARHRPPHAHRQRRRQRQLPAVPARAVRRAEGVGPRPRARPRGPAGLPRTPQHRGAGRRCSEDARVRPSVRRRLVRRPLRPPLARRWRRRCTRRWPDCASDQPVAWSDEHGGFWVVTRYEDVLRVAQDWQTFSSAEGVNVPAPTGAGERHPRGDGPAAAPRVQAAHQRLVHARRSSPATRTPPAPSSPG